MLPDFSTWLRNTEPLVLEERVRISRSATLWPYHYGRVRSFKGDQIGVHLPGLTIPGKVDWYPRDLLEKCA